MNQEVQSEKKSKNRKVLITSIIFFSLSVSLVLFSLLKKKDPLNWDVLVKTKKSKFFLAKIMKKTSGKLLLTRYSHLSLKIQYVTKQLLESPIKEIIPITDIKYISFLDYKLDDILSKHLADKKEKDKLRKNLPPKKFLGKYKIRVLGHKGILYLGIQRNRLVGSVRFPNWARGKWERLKGVHINGRNLYFVRSIENERERRRIGAPHYFKQVYKARFYENGRKITGTYSSKKENSSWEGMKP